MMTLFRPFAFMLGVLAASIVVAPVSAQSNLSAPKKVAGPSTARVSMSEQAFWLIVKTTIAFESNPDQQLVALQGALRRLTTDEIEAFEATFDALMKRSYSWDLWGATYVVHGGASDDAFEYFRCWLISKGQAVFEKVLADPDSLADLLVPDVQGVLEFEMFAYVARNVWGEKTGRKGTEIPTAAPMMYPGINPAGTPFKEDPEHLAKRYPKLWKRFGHAPLG
jgi:hypothetical protein